MSDSATAAPFDQYLRRVWTVVGILAFVVLLGMIVIFGVHVFLVAFFGLLWGNFLYRLSYYVSQWTRIPYGWSMGLVALVISAALLGAMYLFAGRVNEQLGQMVDRLRDVEGTLQKNPAVSKWIERMPDPKDFFKGMDSIKALKNTAEVISETLAEIILVYVLGIYFAANPGLYYDGFVKLFPIPLRDRVREVLNALGHTLWSWTLGRLSAMAIIGVSTGIGLWALGMPLPAGLGFLAALMTFIPNIGPFIAAAPALLIAFQQGSTEVLYVALLYIIVQATELNLVTPLIQLHQVRLPPAVLMTSQLLFWWFTGLMGLILATPIASLVLVLVKEVYVKDALGDRNIQTASHLPVKPGT
jgi:predicted PurR-regulated permease PerM